MIDPVLIVPGSKMHLLSKEEESRAERLVEVRTARGYTSARAAALDLDLTESTYRSHENKTRPIKSPVARRYAEKFRCTYQWLWAGTGERDEKFQINLPPNAAFSALPQTYASRLIPIRGRARGGVGGEIVLDGSETDHLLGPGSLNDVQCAYGVEVIGDSMEPRYEPGVIVWANPLRPIHKGDYAVFQVRQSNGDLVAFVKRFERFSNGSVIASQFNPPDQLIWDREDVEEMHLIVGTHKR